MPVEMTRFDANEWRTRIHDLRPDDSGYWQGMPIVGPYDVCALMHLRQLLQSYVTLGAATDADVFVLGSGVSLRRECTKIGGLPYWPRSRPWPTSELGIPQPFLAQFNFGESKDICGAVPSDVLLLFARPDLRGGVNIEWGGAANAQDLVRVDEVPIASDIPELCGVRWRCQSFADVEMEEDHWSEVVLRNGEAVHDASLVFTPLGLQIGRKPYLPPWTRILHAGDDVVCSLSSVFPIVGRSFAVLDRENPLSALEAKSLSVSVSPCGAEADVLGVLYVIRSAEGHYRWAHCDY